jgi:hypothetical protein
MGHRPPGPCRRVRALRRVRQGKGRIWGDLLPVILLLCLGTVAGWGEDPARAFAASGDGEASASGPLQAGLPSAADIASVAPFIAPRTPVPSTDADEASVDWKGLARHSQRFLAVEHGFRLATEPGTRAGLKGSFFGNYGSAVANLHGWTDGDEFYVNYLGHPMQGSVAGFLWVHNDRKYRTSEFGRNAPYWRSRLRAAAFAWAYSEQFEIGLVSEASIGAIQKYPPAQGFVDHVITPSLGMAWMIGEDFLDKYVVKRIESRTQNPWIRLFARSGLNPARSFANVLQGSLPWYRETRRGVRDYDPEAERWFASAFPAQSSAKRIAADAEVPDLNGPPPFELGVTFQPERLSWGGGSTPCLGGGGAAAFRVSGSWQLVADVGGCKMLDLGTDLSGDSLTYMVGPRWTGTTHGPWGIYAQILAGGNKLTQERMFPKKKRLLEQMAAAEGSAPPEREEYTEQVATNGLAAAIGGGIQYKLSQVLAVRLAEVSYRHLWTAPMWGRDFSGGLKLTSGVVLQMGTW